MSHKIAIAILIMAAVTYLPRTLPMLILRRPIRNRYILAFFEYVPFAVIAAMTFPDIFSSTGRLPSALIGCAIALILAWHRKSLITVAFGGTITVAIVELLAQLF